MVPSSWRARRRRARYNRVLIIVENCPVPRDRRVWKEAQALLKTAVSSIDSAASKGVIKRGTASRSISRLTVAVSHLK